MKNLLALALIAACSLQSAVAAECVVHVKRVACAGQDAESYKKCNGAQECDAEASAAASEADCAKEALAACENKRTDVTKYKVVTAAFKGASLTGGFSAEGKADAKGTNFCAADRPDLNKCQ